MEVFFAAYVVNEFELTGRTRTHITQLEGPRVALHRDVVAPFLALRDEAARDGMDIVASSAFRDFDAQVDIWNRKYRGERPLYDRDGRPREHASLNEEEIVEAILVWSAVPGASRHHWGTEIDIYDRAALPDGYRVQLLPAEYQSDGIFWRLAGWLDENIHRFGFYRPYDEDRGGVFPEPWHISFAPIASRALASLTEEVIAAALRESNVLGKECVLERLSEVYQRYVANVAVPPAGVTRLA
ncbi:MAG: D-alanyl-D-alanine carboxypeptidase [Proteobacteria bacterium]|nr:MAG: D-alanyl-D-alanine carboxypeptidase [Pseudomonadota bacterium]